jgi:hypothetical protein
MSTTRYRPLDVRPLFKQGGEPFAAIRREVDSLKPAEGLKLVSPFLPSPLIELLKNEGFSARPERLSDGTWETYFSRE